MRWFDFFFPLGMILSPAIFSLFVRIQPAPGEDTQEQAVRIRSLRKKLWRWTAAAAISTSHCRQAGIQDDAIFDLDGLDQEDSFRLLSAWVGSLFDPAWARDIIRSTQGHPVDMCSAAERIFNEIQGKRGRGFTHSHGA